MYTRTFRMPALALAAALGLGALGTSAAEAKPVKPGTPTVSASATEPSIGTYRLTTSWTAVSGATSYRATVVRSGTTLASATLTTTSWVPAVQGTPGQQVTVSVKAVVNRKPGQAGTRTITLDDQIAPTGTYSSTFVTDTGAATITQDSLIDDSPVSGVTRTVDWGDDSGVQAWPSGTTIDHSYPLLEKRYTPTVTLTDAAGHTTVVHSTGVVIDDNQAPTGTYAAGPAAAWSTLTQVTLTQGALSDNWTPAATITRSVDWGDDSGVQAWPSGTTLTHVYVVAGDYTPAVTLTDEAGNHVTVQSSPITVTADTAVPVVTEKTPAHRHSVRAWKRLRGTATDAGTGVDVVSVKAVEKRKGAWYGYDAGTGTWHKARTKGKAFAKSKAFALAADAQGRWTARLAHLRKGTLVTKTWATDHVGNRSATVTTKGILTHR